MRKPIPPSATMSVEAALELLPGAARVFLQRRTDCVGCRLARFCTLADVAEIYDLSLESLLRDFNTAAPSQSVARPAIARGKENPWN